jgi:hypothetical protein
MVRVGLTHLKGLRVLRILSAMHRHGRTLGLIKTHSSRRHGRSRRRNVGVAVTGGVSIMSREQAMSAVIYCDRLVAKLTSLWLSRWLNSP